MPYDFNETQKRAEVPLDGQRYVRPSWDEYFIRIVNEVASRGTCDRGRTGCVITRNNRILCTGYVGAPAGLPHCDEAGHLIHTVTNEDGSVSQHCIRTAHAEQNALMQAAKNGVSVDGATMYMKMEPCFACAKMIINAGIKRVVCQKRYHRANLSREFFKQAGVELVVLEDEVVKYDKQ